MTENIKWNSKWNLKSLLQNNDKKSLNRYFDVCWFGLYFLVSIFFSLPVSVELAKQHWWMCLRTEMMAQWMYQGLWL